MIEELRRLLDLLQGIDAQFDDPDDRDPVAIDEAIRIAESLLIRHEKPDPVAPVGNCYRLPTPPPPPPPVVAPLKFGGRQKTTFTKQPQDEAA
jgi:hypothetical protein